MCLMDCLEQSYGARDRFLGLLVLGRRRVLALRLEGCKDVSKKQRMSVGCGTYAGDTWGTSRESSPASAMKRCSAELLLVGYMVDL